MALLRGKELIETQTNKLILFEINKLGLKIVVGFHKKEIKRQKATATLD